MDFTALKIEYPELPVVEHREDFLELLKNHQVVIVKADTGSGKSTQLPKFLLEYFCGLAEVVTEGAQKFKIGVTEPRRLAALSIADRLREELKDESLVSTKIRFWEEGPSEAPIKVMTDGILLQEFRKDRLFKQYDAIMIDEAHERSLNIDILLGIFKTVLAERRDFKLIVASATLDAKLFEEFYDNSCVMEAEGRTFPVDVEYYFRGEARDERRDGDWYRRENGTARGGLAGGLSDISYPGDVDDSRNGRDMSGKGDSGLIEEACDAILDLENRKRDHLLCFLPTERDIQDLAGDLRKKLDEANFDVLPLFGRMSPDEQRRVFRPGSRTRVVLATNIAETSLTIPGIAYVVDTGMARISRYNAQSRIQGLPVEDISKASARQRTGRAGRVKPGVCIRLYSEGDFEKRDEFTEPEIRRSNLANVVLQLRSLGLEMETFPFLQAPPHSAFRGAYKTLFELGALSADNATARVTKLGREMTRLPMDVSLSAVLLRARDAGVLQPALIVCSALSIQDPRVVPNEEPERTRIRGLHRKFAGHKSDFLTYICLWNGFCSEWDGKSWNKLRKFCDKNSLHFLRCREWVDLYEQFSRILDVKFENRVCPFDSFHRDNLHIALLSGFLGGIARRDLENGCYRLVNGRETHVFPGSDLYGKSVEWLFSAEVRETSRTFLTKAAEIQPEWILQVAEPFCTRRWFEPVWNKERGFVEAVEEISFRGLVISRGHRVDYARVNPDDCAQIFWREAVVMGEMARPFHFMEHNERVLENLRALEARKRQFGLAPSEDALVDYYTRIAHNVNSIKSLKDYLNAHTDQFLKFDANYWLEMNGNGVADGLADDVGNSANYSLRDAFGRLGNKKQPQKAPEPKLGGSIEQFRIGNRMLVGEMVFDATRECDGITMDLPYDLLPELSPAKFAMSMHQWREWMAESVIRELPKAVKKNLEAKRSAIDDAFYAALEAAPHKAPLLSLYEVLEKFLQKEKNGEGVLVPTVNPDKENHLRLHLNVVKSGFAEKFPLELSPEWGSFRMFQAVRPAVVSFGIDFPLEGCCFGWRLGESALMSPAESAFWQSFRKRLERGPAITTSGPATTASGLAAALATGSATSEPAADSPLIADRLNMLETGGVFADGFETVLKIWVLKSLAADHLDASKSVRFTGLEFSRGKKLRDFRNLAATTRSEDEEVRLSLVRACYESGLLGAAAFMRSWNILRDFSVAMRDQGGATFFKGGATFSKGGAVLARNRDGAVLARDGESVSKGGAVSTLHSLYQKNVTLFERLCGIAEILGTDFAPAAAAFAPANATSAPASVAPASVAPANAVSLPANAAPAPQSTSSVNLKSLRESFRPYLKARYLKDHELRSARDLLSRLERTSTDSAEMVDLYLSARAMLEDFAILYFKRGGDATEEVVEDEALAKLKGRFGKLK